MRKLYIFFVVVLSFIAPGANYASWGDVETPTVSDDAEVVSNVEVKPSTKVLPKLSVVNVDDKYLKGYVQAIVDANYSEYTVVVDVKGKYVYLSSMPTSEEISNKIISFVEGVKGIKGVVVDGIIHPVKNSDSNLIGESEVNGEWLPQSVLFDTISADPRAACFSIGYRFDDEAIGRKVVALYVGDIYPIYRWNDVKIMNLVGDMQLSIDPSIRSVFRMNKPAEGTMGTLVNTDFTVSATLTYAADKWSFRGRVYHMSSHLGDQHILYDENVVSRHVGIEAVDLITAYQVSDMLRVFAGPGCVVSHGAEYKVKPLYVEYGAEIWFRSVEHFDSTLNGQPFFAMHIRNSADTHWDGDYTYVAGYEFSRSNGVGRAMRAYIEYHDGFSCEGQFSRQRSNYVAGRISYGF